MHKSNVSASVSPFWTHNTLACFGSFQFNSCYGSQYHCFSFFLRRIFENGNLTSWLTGDADHSLIRNSNTDISNDLRGGTCLIKDSSGVRDSIFVYGPDSSFMSGCRDADYALFSLMTSNSWNDIFVSSFNSPRYTAESRFVSRWKSSHLNCVERVVTLNHSNRISSRRSKCKQIRGTLHWPRIFLGSLLWLKYMSYFNLLLGRVDINLHKLSVWSNN